jgi:hypothetical protein
MMPKKLLLGAFIGFILALSFISAAGCCFTPSTGLCAQNAEESACNPPSEFDPNPSCSIQECDKACCILGTNTEYIPGRECQIKSTAGGFSYPGNWVGMSEEDCRLRGQSEVLGACIYGDQYQRDCRYQTYAECSSGNFNAGAFCTDPALNTTCNSTSETMCFNEDVYGRDSCGNADNVRTDCDFNAGTMCSQNITAGRYSAICKNLNCDKVGKKNGQSWCVFGNSESPIEYSSLSEIGGESGEIETSVGSKFYRKYCLNGEVVTEPCEEFRMGYCQPGAAGGEAKCENNEWSPCLSASKMDPLSGATVIDSEKCDEKFCYPWAKDMSMGCNVYDYAGGDCVVRFPWPFDTCMIRSAPGTVCFEDGVMYNLDDNGDVTSANPHSDPSTNPKYTPTGESRVRDPLYYALGAVDMVACVPKIPGGLNFYGSATGGGASSAEATCNKLNYAKPVVMARDTDGDWWCVQSCYFFGGTDVDGKISLSKVSKLQEVYAFQFAWNNGGTNKWNDWFNVMYDKSCGGGYTSNFALREDAFTIANARCRWGGDCDSKPNWINEGSGPSAESPGMSGYCSKSTWRGYDSLSFPIEAVCSAWEASDDDSNCDKCGTDKLPCSEYRCKALGSCDYYEEGGVDQGFCMASSDNVGPTITSITSDPQSPIPPYSPVEITLTTNEVSRCKFNLNSAAGSYDTMPHDFGTDYATEHKIRLTLPGQVAGIDRTLPEYSLITDDGIYVLYVRCIDPAGNGKTAQARPFQFEVMMKPDGIAPSPSGFTPVSGSRIIYNTTQKLINFNIGEPAQCRWDFQETYNMSKMKYSFTCDESVHSDPLDTYECSGIMTNVTLNLTEETTYYIRCKDNPQYTSDTIVENGVEYSRNEMTYAYVYTLRPSEKFSITEVTPSGLTEAPSTNLNLTINARTQGGAFYGKAKCWWRHANSSEEMGRRTFTKFRNTDSSVSTQLLTSPYVGDNWLGVMCEDDVGNEDGMNVSFNLVIDDSSPFVNRVYEQAGKLRVKTDESSICYVSFNRALNCLFDFQNSTLMSGLFTLDHDITWNDDEYYYLRCKDIFGNYDIGCGKILRTY